MTTTIPFRALVQNAEINVRTSSREQNIETLAASILAHGVLQPIAVRPQPGSDYHVDIIDGDRRYAAIKLLVERGDFDADIMVPVHYPSFDSVATESLREASLAANIEREPLHPVDEFEAFSALAKTMKPAQIAERFGVSEKQVRQRIALGDLHPEIRDAWREGKMDDGTAKVFTLAPDRDRQLAIFTVLHKKHHLYAHNVKEALGVNANAAKAIKVIGIEAYRAAGGQVIEDLFGGDSILSDHDLAKRLLADRLKVECDRLVADGWAFAHNVDSVKDLWNWPRLAPSGKAKPTEEENARLLTLREEIRKIKERGEGDDGLSDEDEEKLGELEAEKASIETAVEFRRWGPRQKKMAGCFVDVSWDGEIKIEYGVQNPTDAVKAKKEKASAAGSGDAGDVEEAKKPALSIALTFTLSEQLTIAASKTLAQDPLLALRVTVATLESIGPRGPVKLRDDGYSALQTCDDSNTYLKFGQRIADLLAASDEVVIGRLAIAVSKALDMRNFNGGASSEETLALLGALDARDFAAAAREVFDAAAYFKGVKADLCNAALDEMGACMAPGSRPKKKAELVTMCVDNAKVSGWLPLQLRHPEGSAR